MGTRRLGAGRRPPDFRRGHGRRLRRHRSEVRLSHHAPGNLPASDGGGLGGRRLADRTRTVWRHPFHPVVLSGSPGYLGGRQRQRPDPDGVRRGHRRRPVGATDRQDRRPLPRAGHRQHGVAGGGDVSPFHHERGHEPDPRHELRVRRGNRGGWDDVHVPAGGSELGAVQTGGHRDGRAAVFQIGQRHGRACRAGRRVDAQPRHPVGRNASRKRQGRPAAGPSRCHQERPTGAGRSGCGGHPESRTHGSVA